jgi:hypothetical protein
MKLKSIILLSLILIIAGNVLAQKTDPPKAPAKPADVKSPPPAAKLPTVAEILAKYVQAIGGREANEKIKTRISKGTIEISPMGIKGTVEEYKAAPDKTYSAGNLTGVGVLIESYDGKTSWSSNPMQGSRDKTGQELLQSRLASNFYREINLEKLYPKMELKGIEKVGDIDAYVVIATPDGIPSETFYFDTVSGLLVRSDSTAIAPEGNAAIKTFYEDYREIDGVKIPFKLRAVLPQAELITTFTEIRNNVPISDTKFQKPM